MVSPAGLNGSHLKQAAVAETWDGERLCCYTCPLGALAKSLPSVERRPFVVTSSDADVLSPQLSSPSQLTENPYYDPIVRRPDRECKFEIPLGIVSKRYRLVPWIHDF